MPTDRDRSNFANEIKSKNEDQIRAFLQRDDVKELLLMKDEYGYLPIHSAYCIDLDIASLQLILDAGVQHGIAKQMLEEKNEYGLTCLHFACRHDLSFDSPRLLLEYLLKHADIKKVLEEKTFFGSTCLHAACLNWMSLDSLRLLLEYLSKYADIEKVLEERDTDGQTCLHIACMRNWSIDSVRFLISFFPSKDFCTRALGARDGKNSTPADNTPKKLVKQKQLLQQSDCFEKCRLWLLRNQENTFLHSLFPNSFDKTCQALKELKNGLQETPEHATMMLIALIPSPSKFREAIDKTDSSAPMASYFNVVKKGDKTSDCKHWRKNIRLFREFYGQWPPTERKTASTYEGEGNSSCSIQ